MTKAKLSRLIFLESLHGLNGEEIAELLALQGEFESWEPEELMAQRDEARQIARELLEDADADDWDEHRMQKRYPWLKEKPVHG